MGMSGAASPDEELGGEDGGDVPIADVIRGFLDNYDHLYEFRLQKLVYVAELVHWLDEGDRLTDADFKPYMYGSYSEAVGKTLQSLEEEIPHETSRKYGNITTKYKNPGSDSSASAGGHQQLLEAVADATRDAETADLEDWSKQSWLYRNTEYDSEMDFEDIDEKGAREQVREELLNAFPKLAVYLDDE